MEVCLAIIWAANTACVICKFKSTSTVMHVYLGLCSTDKNMEGYMATCKWLPWITSDTRQGEGRRPVGTTKKNRMKHVCE